jgi:hypothetical protein
MVYDFSSKFTRCSIDTIKRFVIIALGWFIASTVLGFVVLVCLSLYPAIVPGADAEHVRPEPKVLAMVTALTTLEIMAFYWLIRVKKDRKYVEPQQAMSLPSFAMTHHNVVVLAPQRVLRSHPIK